MHGHATPVIGLVGSVIACVIGGWNSKGMVIPLPKGSPPAIAPVFDCGYQIVSHSAREKFYPGMDWGVQVTCTVENIKASRDGRLRCKLPFGGAVYAREQIVSLSRGANKKVQFDYPEPTLFTGFLESLSSNDPTVGYSFDMELVPWKGWVFLKWIGGGTAVIFGLAIACVFSTEHSVETPTSSPEPPGSAL